MNFLIKNMSIFAVVFLFFIAFDPTSASAGDGWVHSEEPFDYKKGLLNDSYIIEKNDLKKEMYDDDVGTEWRWGVEDDSFSIEFKKPVDITGAYINIRNAYSNVYFLFEDERIRELDTGNGTTDSYVDLNHAGVVKIILDKSNTGVPFIREIDFFGSYQKEKYPPVKVLELSAKSNSINVKFKKPDKAKAVDIWINEKKIDRTTKETYVYENLKEDTEYDLKFVNYYGDDNYGSAVKEKVRTKKKEVGEVENLDVKAKSHEQINLSWVNPSQLNFSHVTIYRDEIKEKNFFNLFSVAQADEPSKLFETNGNYFIDHSVSASTSYNYLVTTTDKDGRESKGVSSKVKTPKKTNPDPPKSEIEKDENGDYLLTWVSPKTGDVLIKINGKNYKRLKASAGSYLIPGEDMVYSILGKPKVELIAIDEDGDESGGRPPGPPGSTENGGNGSGGGIGDLGEIGGIDAKDVLQGTMSFIRLMSPLILLGIIVFFVPRLISVIKVSIGNNRQ